MQHLLCLQNSAFMIGFILPRCSFKDLLDGDLIIIFILSLALVDWEFSLTSIFPVSNSSFTYGQPYLHPDNHSSEHNLIAQLILKIRLLQNPLHPSTPLIQSLYTLLTQAPPSTFLQLVQVEQLLKISPWTPAAWKAHQTAHQNLIWSPRKN